MTYAAPLRSSCASSPSRSIQETGAKSVIDIKEQDVYMGDMPLMTMNGTFVINGTERVIVRQMHRSPGVLFDTTAENPCLRQVLFAARIIPYRGSLARLRVRRQGHRQCPHRPKRKLPVTTLLYALGMTTKKSSTHSTTAII